MSQELKNIQKSSATTGQKEQLIEIIDLEKSFGNQAVLQKINLTLYQGENLVVMGKSGSGKSVLIKCIAGLLKADSGIIKVFDKDVINCNRKELAEIRKKIGFLFQSGALYDSMTVKQNLEFPLRRILNNLSDNEVKLKIEEVLENVGLSDTINKMPSQLSGGMRKRISLARTIVVDPQIILYDEPTTGLDPITSDEISLLINKIKNKYHTSSIIITHDIKCAEQTADRIVMLNEGVVYKVGPVNEFKESKDELIHSFFK